MSSAIGKSTDNYIPLASPASLEEGSAPDASPKSGRWSKICDWCKAHEEELVITAFVIAIIAGIALTWLGAGMIAVAAYDVSLSIGILSTGLSLVVNGIIWGRIIAWENYRARGK
jgi:hypothetical protein